MPFFKNLRSIRKSFSSIHKILRKIRKNITDFFSSLQLLLSAVNSIICCSTLSPSVLNLWSCITWWSCDNHTGVTWSMCVLADLGRVGACGYRDFPVTRRGCGLFRYWREVVVVSGRVGTLAVQWVVWYWGICVWENGIMTRGGGGGGGNGGEGAKGRGGGWRGERRRGNWLLVEPIGVLKSRETVEAAYCLEAYVPANTFGLGGGGGGEGDGDGDGEGIRGKRRRMSVRRKRRKRRRINQPLLRDSGNIS